MPDDRFIVELDVPHAPAALEPIKRLGSRAVFYKIGLGILTTSGLAVANEIKAGASGASSQGGHLSAPSRPRPLNPPYTS